MGVSSEMFARIRKMSRQELVQGIAVMVDVVDMVGVDMQYQLEVMKAELRYRDGAAKTVIRNRSRDKTLREVQDKLSQYRLRLAEAVLLGDASEMEYLEAVVFEIESKWLRKLEAAA